MSEEVTELITPPGEVLPPKEKAETATANSDQTAVKVVEAPPIDILDASIPEQVETLTASAPAGEVQTPPPTGTIPPVTATAPAPEAPRKPGRPPGSRNKPKADFSDLSTAEAVAVDYAAMAAMTFDASANGLASILGPEWLARDEKERQFVVDAIEKYYKSKQVKDLPPGVILSLVLSAYAIPRLNAPSTASKIKSAWFWLRSKLTRKKVT